MAWFTWRHNLDLAVQERDASRERAESAEADLKQMRELLSKTSMRHLPRVRQDTIEPEHVLAGREVLFECRECQALWPCRDYITFGRLAYNTDPTEWLQHVQPLTYAIPEPVQAPPAQRDSGHDLLRREALRHIPYTIEWDLMPGNLLYAPGFSVRVFCDECSKQWPCSNYTRLAYASQGIEDDTVKLPKLPYQNRSESGG